MRSVTRCVSIRLGALALATLAALPGACSYGSAGGMVVGSGSVTSQTRSVADFTEVQAGAGIQLELATGPHQVVVTAQPNIVGITTTEVSGSRLTVDTTSGYVTREGLVVKLTAPSLTAIGLSGGAGASGTAGTPEKLAIDMSGGARATLSGSIGDLDLGASGGAIADLGGLRARDASVSLSGGVVATLTVSGSLNGSASGGVVLTLTTRPASSNVDTSGGAVLRTP
ncbi:GIN domain-containing protein [Monashia sp. NPDC004114]